VSHFEDAELLTELRQTWRTEFNTAVEPLRKQIQAIAARSSRPPGTMELASLDAPQSLSTQLAADASFAAWVKSQKTHHSAYACELRAPAFRKAGTPISGLSPTEHVPGIWGTPGLPLRLRSLLPQVPTATGNLEITVEQSYAPSAGVIAEGAMKPQLSASYVLSNVRCQTIAQFVKASVQSLSDTPQLAQWLDGRLIYSVSLQRRVSYLKWRCHRNATHRGPYGGRARVQLHAKRHGSRHGCFGKSNRPTLGRGLPG
jgi:HK97 family phage major capsid protein